MNYDITQVAGSIGLPHWPWHPSRTRTKDKGQRTKDKGQRTKDGTIRGFTLGEMLVTVAILGVIAGIVTPLLSSNDPQKLSVAAEETANALRFAFSEAKRTGGYVLVEGKAAAGHLTFYYSDDKAKLDTNTIKDPLTKRAMELDTANHAFSNGVTLTPQFRAGGSVWKRLLIGPGLTQMQGFDNGASGTGVLQANSGVLLSLGSQSVMVRINETTGLVTLP